MVELTQIFGEPSYVSIVLLWWLCELSRITKRSGEGDGHA